MAGTYADMRARIADELANDGDISTSQINNAIQSTIADYSGEAFWFNEATSTLNTVANQETYGTADWSAIPNIIRINTIKVITSGASGYNLSSLMNDQIEDIQDGTVKGRPEYYARYANQIRLYPIPDAVYSIRFTYISTLSTLSADGDTNSWMTDGEELIRQGAKKRLAADILMSDEIANRCAAMEKEAYDGLRQKNRNRRSQQFLRTELPNFRDTFNIYRGW
jgi:hypothetical protein